MSRGDPVHQFRLISHDATKSEKSLEVIGRPGPDNVLCLRRQAGGLESPVRRIAPGQVPRSIPALIQKTRGIVRPLSDGAAEPEIAILRQLKVTGAQLGERQVDRLWYVPAAKLIAFAHVQ